MWSKTLSFGTLMLIASLVDGPKVSQAQSPAVSIRPGNLAVYQSVLGFQFLVGSDPIEVSALGFYQDAMRQWADVHQVGIFDMSQNLLTSAVVTSSSLLEDLFRYEHVNPIRLSANTSYVIAGTTGQDRFTFSPVSFQVNPAITYEANRFSAGTTLAFPGPPAGNWIGWFGPNFKLQAVPEPGALALLVGMGAGGARFLRRRARR